MIDTYVASEKPHSTSRPQSTHKSSPSHLSISTGAVRKAKEKLGFLEKSASTGSPRSKASPKSRDQSTSKSCEDLVDWRGHKAVGRGKAP